MQNPNEWLISKVAADMNTTNEQLLQNPNAIQVIQRYIVAEIETYEDLIKELHNKVGA